MLSNFAFDVCCGRIVFAANTKRITFIFIEAHLFELNHDDLNCECECRKSTGL